MMFMSSELGLFRFQKGNRVCLHDFHRQLCPTPQKYRSHPPTPSEITPLACLPSAQTLPLHDHQLGDNLSEIIVPQNSMQQVDGDDDVHIEHMNGRRNNLTRSKIHENVNFQALSSALPQPRSKLI